MFPPHSEYPPILREAQDVPESHRAGHFEHVAHMNMFHSERPTFRIPPKISFLKLSSEEADPSGLGDKKINASDPARESDLSNKLIKQVKLDLRLSDGVDKSGPENSTSSSSSAKERRKSKGRGKENPNKTQARKGDNEQMEWAKAKEKVEEFLDFPGVMAAMAYRNQAKADGSSQISSRNGGGLVSRSETDAIPNTRHNAIFLRDHEKAAEAVLRNHRKGKLPQAVDSHQTGLNSGDHGTKMVERPNSLIGSIVTESDTGTER